MNLPQQLCDFSSAQKLAQILTSFCLLEQSKFAKFMKHVHSKIGDQILNTFKLPKIQQNTNDKKKMHLFFPPGLYCDFYFILEKEGTDKCINELCRELLLKDNSAVFPWQYVKRRNYLIVAGFGKEIRAFLVHKWQNIKMLQCCVPRANEGVLSFIERSMNVQNPHFKLCCVKSRSL